jgi:hypothetical protein
MSAEHERPSTPDFRSDTNEVTSETKHDFLEADPTALARPILRDLIRSLRSSVLPNDLASTETQNRHHIYGVENRREEADTALPLLSVILIASNGVDTALNDALVSLDAQSVRDFELVVVTPGLAPDAHDHVEERLAHFSSDLMARTRVVVSSSQAGRSDARAFALRTGLDSARGRYVSVLDATSIVFANYVETFARLAHNSPSAVLRARAISQPMHLMTWPNGQIGFEPTAGARPASGSHFSALEHLLSPQSPPGSYALSRSAFDDSGPEIDEDEILVEAAILGGVQEASDEVVVLLRHFDM